jgi:hypothetical protein
VLARELESGTFRFAWTQGAGRLRLAAARLIPLAVLLTAAAYGLSALFSWYFTPFLRFGNTGGYPMQLFGNLGTDFAAWALFSFALAAFLGVLLRRAVAATALSLAVTTVLDVVTMMALRQHYATPVTVSGAGPTGNGDWVLGNWFTSPGGARVSVDTVDNRYIQAQGGYHVSVFPATVVTWATHNHYTQWWFYQPAARWWQLQLTEGAWLLAASLLLITATILLIRRRPALADPGGELLRDAHRRRGGGLHPGLVRPRQRGSGHQCAADVTALVADRGGDRGDVFFAFTVVDRVAAAADLGELLEQGVNAGQRAGSGRVKRCRRVPGGDFPVAELREQGLAGGRRVRGQDAPYPAPGAHYPLAFQAVEVKDAGIAAQDAEVHGLAGQLAQVH